ncbi:MAG TPA: hypothetical protein VEV20_01855 [Burkholderiales bacterium]|nr:hypothetical protein [Burkholderiales bacterium]
MRLILGCGLVLVAAAALAQTMVVPYERLGTNRSVVLTHDAQPAQCLHGANEASDQRARRQGALFAARMINSLEAVASQPQHGGTYVPLADLKDFSPLSTDFTVSLTADKTSYAFMVKDTTDPCHFAFYSDQTGLIYAGEVIR